MIRMVSILDTLYPRVSHIGTGLNQQTAIDRIRAVVDKFCRATSVSQDEIETSIAAGDNTLTVQAPNSSLVIHRVLSVTAPNRRLVLISKDDLDARCPRWRTATGQPNFVTHNGRDELLLSSTPDTAEDPVKVCVALAPSLTATRIDSELAERYGAELEAGIAESILGMTGQPWYDARAAAEQGRIFRVGISRARAQAANNQTFAEHRPMIRRIT